MKVYIGPYKNYFGTYQLTKKIFFWVKDDIMKEEDTIVDKVSDWLEYKRDGKTKTLLARFLLWLDEKIPERKIKVRIDDYDAWSGDKTIATILVPLLEKIQHNKHSFAIVSDEDVPEHLRSTNAPALTEEEMSYGHPDEFAERRWDWVLEEIIWTFQQYAGDDWEEQHYYGEVDWKIEKTLDGFSTLREGPNHTFKVDLEGRKAHIERMKNGRLLFAKYYDSLWV